MEVGLNSESFPKNEVLKFGAGKDDSEQVLFDLGIVLFSVYYGA